MQTAEDILKDKKRDMITASPDQTVRAVLEAMRADRIGAMLIKRADKIVGIWTERDLARDILIPGFDIDTARVGDYMTTKLYTAPHDTPILKLEEMFLGLFVRHILIVQKRKTVGLLSIGDVLRASLLEKDRQIRNITADASWEDFENWGWGRGPSGTRGPG
jgi:signal-transduction protein with cAMP-binding, CBS, and nucleotidyltransferase domain